MRFLLAAAASGDGGPVFDFRSRNANPIHEARGFVYPGKIEGVKHK
jgi:hypothetical protein